MSGNASNVTPSMANSGENDTADEWMDTTPRIVFLSVFMCVGLVANLLLVITVCQSPRFRAITFFIFVVNLAFINILECLINMTLLLATSIISEWTLGDLLCKFGSFFINLILIEAILGLTVTTLDRFVALRFRNNYANVISTSRVAVLIVITWTQASAFSVPIAIGEVDSDVNNFIIYCNVSKGSAVAYTVITVILCFIAPFILICIFFIKIIRSGYKARFSLRNASAQKSYNEDFTNEPPLKQEILYANITLTLCVAWFVLEGPHMVTSYYSQLTNSSELGNMTPEQLRYVWYVDLVLLWLRFSYPMALPIAAFTWNKELWKCFKDFILCRKNNSITDESFQKGDSDTFRLDRKIKEEKMKWKEKIVPPKEQRVFQVPVLFATSHGVHVKTYDKNETSDQETDDNSSKTNTLKGKKCDVIGSRDNLNHVEGDTSDYDSGNEMDPFSVSHPISVRQITNGEFSERKRSVSEPEVRENSDEKRNSGNVKNNLSKNVEGDSGLDLSIFQNSNGSHGKGTFRVPNANLMLQNTQLLQTEILDKSTLQQMIPRDANIESSTCIEVHVENEKCIPNGYSTRNETHTVSLLHENEESPKTKITAHLDTNLSVESPLPKRKKKKRREKTFDTQSITSLTSNSSTIPPRPPVRLAPIPSAVMVRSLYASSGRPDSSCSSQCSNLDNNLEVPLTSLRRDSSGDVIQTDVRLFDNVSLASSVGHYSGAKTSRDSTLLQLDCTREIESVPEEVISPSGCTLRAISESNGPSENSDSHSGIVNGGFCDDSDNNSPKITLDTPVKTKNVAARRKRREKIVSQEKPCNGGLISTNAGYQRLVPETP